MNFVKIPFLTPLILALAINLNFIFPSQPQNNSYANLIGLSPNKIDNLTNYKEVVIDAQNYTKAQIDYLHSKGVIVYSYLNIGSLENFRDYYNDFSDYTLSPYYNWKEEEWIDVSSNKWRNFLAKSVSKELFNKGVDGFFLDNVDIYALYKNDATFDGILNIITDLKSAYNKPIIINNGYDFLNEALLRNLPLSNLIYGVNREEVFTHYDFDHKSFKTNNEDDKNFVLDHLNTLKKLGINIYVIEYSKKASLNRKIYDYFNKIGYKVYISNNIQLK